MDTQLIKVLVVGQIPPPFHGQAMMIERLVKTKYEKIQILHVRMNFSKSIDSVGTIRYRKLIELFRVLFKVILIKYKHNPSIFYYPPAGPNLVPIIRDFILLTFTRPLFKYTVFHFRSAGISDFMKSLSQGWLLRIPYFKPTVAIQLSGLNPSDGEYFKAKKTVIIPNGIEDEGAKYLSIRKSKTKFIILCIGALKESKGILTLIEALNIVVKDHKDVMVNFIGAFDSAEFKNKVQDKIVKYKISNHVEFQGVATGAEKWMYFSKASILCFPTFYECESFGNVILEAMMFELPVVASSWRAIPGIVDESFGLLHSPQNEKELAEKIIFLKNNPDKRNAMGIAGRKLFLQKYKLDVHLSQMEDVFVSL